MQFNINSYEKLNIQASSEYLGKVLFNTIFEKKDITLIWNSYARRRWLVFFTVTGVLATEDCLLGTGWECISIKRKTYL